MGLHLTMVLLREDGTEVIETDVRYKSPLSGIRRSYIRDGVIFDKFTSIDFLLADPHVCHWFGRGVPEWLTTDQREELEDGIDPTWFTVEELLSTDWDLPLRPWPDPAFLVPQLESRREKLGEEFIKWVNNLKALEVVKVALSAS